MHELKNIRWIPAVSIKHLPAAIRSIVFLRGIYRCNIYIYIICSGEYFMASCPGQPRPSFNTTCRQETKGTSAVPSMRGSIVSTHLRRKSPEPTRMCKENKATRKRQNCQGLVVQRLGYKKADQPKKWMPVCPDAPFRVWGPLWGTWNLWRSSPWSAPTCSPPSIKPIARKSAKTPPAPPPEFQAFGCCLLPPSPLGVWRNRGPPKR